MQNVETQIVDGKLHVIIDMKAEPTRSASGKTMIVASTRGNRPVDTPDGTLYVGVNAFRYNNRKEDD